MLLRRVGAEAVGTMLLVTAVVGSGIAAQRLSPDPGVELLVNAFATAGALAAILLALGPVHLNPAVTAAAALFRRTSAREVLAYVPAQVAGGCLGAVLANLMYDRAAVSLSAHSRGGTGLVLAEVVATAGLVLVAFGVREGREAFAVAAYIAAAYFFTSSTSFANPAVTVARTLSDTFAGIAPRSVAAFVLAQGAGTIVGAGLVRALVVSE